MKVTHLRTKIFAEGAELEGMFVLSRQPIIKGLSTSPTRMREAGITDYRAFAREVVRAIPDRPISFAVLSDEFADMERQAREIASWGQHVYVTLPVTNTRREVSYDLIGRLSHEGIKVNVTAVMTLDQVKHIVERLRGGAPSTVSILAGHIADTGRDPLPMLIEAVRALSVEPSAELIWASPRELFNVFQADEIGCHIVTLTHDLLKKLSIVGKDLDEYSLETVKAVYDDVTAAGFTL